ncbi:MAG TPA: M14 family zinc carboxypeptidase [archaeon]|nr:M14 family zinc carboxypeptidase [archaeon]
MLLRVFPITVFWLVWLAGKGFGGQEEIEVLAGFDGANPQAREDIVRETPYRFRVKTFNEEGSNDAYWFRFNVKAVNHGEKTRDVEFLVEWPVLERHPDYEYDTYFYGDMGHWHWVYANIEGTVAKLVVPAPPGTTYVGFYPRYSYGYFEQFMESLAQGEKLKKWVEGQSFFGRNIWCVRITDPGVPDSKKKTVLLTARNHPYETSGSYITEEIITWLGSGDPETEKLLRENVIYLVPMMNPDGVALGCNQRTRGGGVNMSFGADTDDPAVLTLLSLVKKVRPVLWADIHSWPHQGDDGMWCTHQWVADGLLARLPDKWYDEYVWDVSFVRDRGTAENHLWQWLIRTFDSGGVSLSISWYRRSEEDIRKIGRELLKAICFVAGGR